MPEDEQYQALISDIVAKQAVILGPDIAILKARSVAGLEIADDGKVIRIKADPGVTLRKLIDVYVDLSGQIVKNALGSVFAKYPSIGKME